MKLTLAILALGAALQAQKLREVCGACHTEPASDFESHIHRVKGLDCDACHGPSQAHRDATGHKPVDRIAGPSEQPAVCGACHAAQSKEYQSSKHGRAMAARSEAKAPACTTCHGTHSQRQAAAMIVQCKRCHASLPAACSQPPPASTAKVSCANCHAKHTLQARR